MTSRSLLKNLSPVSGHDISRAANAAISTRASAPEGEPASSRSLFQQVPGSAVAGILRRGIFSLAVTALALVAGCHSYHVDATVENRTGAPIKLLEVDYPSASFGANSLADGEVFHYRIQLRGSAPLKVQYTTADERQVQIAGPSVSERQEGALEIVLVPGGNAEFHPHLTPAP